MKEKFEFIHAVPESCGVPSDVLTDYVEYLKTLDAIHSFTLMRHDRIIAQTWWKPFKKEYKHELFSCSKSFVSAAFGIAQGEKLVSLNDKLVDFFPEKMSEKVSERMKKVTLRNLLTMASGHSACPLAGGVISGAQDVVKAFLETELEYEPGSKFIYNSAATYMVSAVLRKVTGMNVREYLNEKLFKYMDIIPEKWDCCPGGINIGGWGFWAKSEDLLRFGRLLLNKGNWNGRQLIPEDYLAEATSFQIDNSANDIPDWKIGYGYQFWRTSFNSFRCDGACGQYILVMPEKDLVMVITAGLPNMQQILTEFWNKVYPWLKDDALPENPEKYRELQQSLQSCIHMPIASELRFVPENKKYCIAENELGLQEIAIDFDADGCSLKFIWQSGEIETLRADYGRHFTNKLRLQEPEERILEASAAWLNENELDIQVYAVETPYRDHYYLRFSDDGIEVERQSNFAFLHNTFPVFSGKEIVD